MLRCTYHIHSDDGSIRCEGALDVETDSHTLLGKVQQAYITMAPAEAEVYDKVNAATLRHYEESHHRRFQSTKPK